MNKLPVIYLLLCYTIYCGTPGGTQPGRKITEIKLRLLLSNKIKYKVSSLGLVLPWFNFLKIYANLFFLILLLLLFFSSHILVFFIGFFFQKRQLMRLRGCSEKEEVNTGEQSNK